MKKVPVNLMLGTIHLLNKCISFSLCLSGDRGLLFFPQKMKELSPLMGTQGLLAESRVIIVLGDYQPVLFRQQFILAPNSHHKTHSLQWDSTVAIPPAGEQLLLPSLCRKRVEALQAGRAGAGIPKAWLSHSLLSFFKTCFHSSIAQLKTKQNKE